MSGTGDKVDRRIKEAAAALTNDDDAFRGNGKRDQAAGKTKDAAQKMKDAAEKRVNTIRDILKRNT